MPFKPVEKILVSDGILEQIRDLIHSGEFPPGQRLPSEMKMSELFSASRSSLREALNALVHLGYLQRRNKGIYVNPEMKWRTNLPLHSSRSQKDLNIAEMIEVRKIIETQLCALAAKRADPKDIEALEESFHRMEVQIHDPAAFIDSDHHFHLQIAKAARNHLLGEFVEKIRDLLRDNIALIVGKSNISRRSLSHHQRIFEAIRCGDALRARRLMAGHLAEIEKEFFKILCQSSTSSSIENRRVVPP